MGNSLGSFRKYWRPIRKYPKYQGGFIWGFADQSIRWKKNDGTVIYGYGGDFNAYHALQPNFWRAPTDNDFGANLQQKMAIWKNPQMELASLEHQV